MDNFKPILKLSETDGNAFAILGEAQKVAKENGMDFKQIHKEAIRGNYNDLIQVIMEYFEII